MQPLSKTVLLTTLSLISLAPLGRAADETGSEMYRAKEFSIDAFGSGVIGRQTIDNFSGRRVSDDVKLGVGVGMNYFITRHFGVGADAHSGSLSGSFVDSASAQVIGRLPIGDSGLAPYIFGGGGHQFEGIEQWFGHAGVGVEIRFHQNWGVFTDARYVLADETDGYGVGRLGIRWSF